MVAIKIISKNKFSVEEFDNEMRIQSIANKLNGGNEHTVKILEVFEDNKNMIIVMELAQTDLWHALIKKTYHITQQFTRKQYVCAILLQLGKILKQLNEHWSIIIHQDVKLANILFDTDTSGNLQLKLTDFGVATQLKNIQFAEFAVGGSMETMTSLQLWIYFQEHRFVHLKK
eukprot:284962_1